jgi:5'-3' exonuclease
LWAGYKDGSGMDPLIMSQFGLLEDAITAMGLTVWPMVEFEADDAMGAAAVMAAADDRVDRVLICTPDKDLGQVVGGKIVQFDRRKRQIFDREGVIEKFGVPPECIADYLALVGDSADGFPGLSGWGAKSSSTLLARYGSIEGIPLDSSTWDVAVRGGAKLAARLAEDIDLALLFRRIATLETDAPVGDSIDPLLWEGPTENFEAMCDRIDGQDLLTRARRLADKRRVS